MLTLAFTIHSFMWEHLLIRELKILIIFYMKTDVMKSLLQLVPTHNKIKTFF